MKNLIWLGTVFITMTFTGCGYSHYAIRTTDGQHIYLNYEEGTDVRVGDVYVLYQIIPIQSGIGHGGHGAHRGTQKRELGRVRVIRIADETRAEVEVIFGTLEEGIQIERLR